jgi:hypothetical protein
MSQRQENVKVRYNGKGKYSLTLHELSELKEDFGFDTENLYALVAMTKTEYRKWSSNDSKKTEASK